MKVKQMKAPSRLFITKRHSSLSNNVVIANKNNLNNSQFEYINREVVLQALRLQKKKILNGNYSNAEEVLNETINMCKE